MRRYYVMFAAWPNRYEWNGGDDGGDDVNIDIRTRGFSLTPGLRAHVERRLELALDRYEERIVRIRVLLGDANGPKGGKDKSCRIEVRIRGGRAVRATAVDGDAYVAIGTAAHRAARTLSRALERERTTMVELLWLARAMSPRPVPSSR